MAKTPLRTSPQTPRLWGFLSSRAIRWITVLALVAFLICMFVVIVGALQGIGQPPTNVGRTTKSEKPIEDDDGEFKQKKYAKREKWRLIRCGLQEIDQEAQEIWDDIGKFENEATQWHAKLQELLISERGKRLRNDNWVVRYFWEQRGDKLPRIETAENCRDNLNTLMLTVHEALEDPQAGYVPTQLFLDEVDLIKDKIADGKRRYNSHGRLLDALVGVTEPGGPKPTETLQDAVDQYDWQKILQDFGHPDYVERDGRARGDAPAAAEGNVPDSLDEVYEQGAGRSTVGRDFGRTTTIQDAVSEPKKRGDR